MLAGFLIAIYLVGIIPSGKLYVWLERDNTFPPANHELFLITFLWFIAMPIYLLCRGGQFIVERIDYRFNNFCDWIRK